MWGREIAGLRLTFHLAGINNQNFLMRDDQTGTYWQQISGKAVSGPLAGASSPRSLGRTELRHMAIGGAAGHRAEGCRTLRRRICSQGLGRPMERAPTVIDFPEHGLKGRDVMLGIQAFGASRAFPYDQVMREKLVKDHVGVEPVLLVVGPDGESVRAFRDAFRAWSRSDFYRVPGTRRRALDGRRDGQRLELSRLRGFREGQGSCLERDPDVKDYWFDWRNYNPKTTVYGRSKETW